MTENTNLANYLNPVDFYAETLETWKDLWDESKPLYENLKEIVSQSVFLPDRDVQIPVAISYMMTSQKWAKVLPLMLCYGREGTGKSTLTKLASHLRSSEILGQSSTFASIRNELNNSRWLDEEGDLERDGATLLFDNVYASTFTLNANLLALILSGYDKSSDKLMIASAGGENINFRTFSSKVISSVEPIWLDPKLKELARRLIVIRHQRLEELKDEYESFENRLDLDSIEWGGIEKVYFDFWNKRFNVELYVKTRNLLTKRGKKPFTIPESLPSDKWAISVDLICTGISIGAWSDIQEAVNHMNEFFRIQTEKLATSESSIQTFLRLYIEKEVGTIEDWNRGCEISGHPKLPMTLNALKLTEFLKEKEKESLLDVRVDSNVEREYMFLLGWKKGTQGWEKV
jgi:hypothetical protein